MAYTTTRSERGERWRTTPVIVFRTFLATAIAASVLQILDIPAALAQVAPPSKKALKVQKGPVKPSSPTDNEADQLNEKWLSEFNKSNADSPAATPAAAKPASPQAAQTTAPPQAPTASPAPAPQAA